MQPDLKDPIHRIRGICPLTAVPFTETGEVDYRQFEELVMHLARSGVHGIGLFGVVSEFYKLSDAERMKLAALMIPKLKGTGVFSLISVTDHATELAVQRARAFEQMGADCLMLLPPHFLAPAPDQIFRHLTEVVRSVRIPVIVQYAPNETGVSIPPEDLVQIARTFGHVLFKIECTDPATYSRRLLELRPELSIMNGYWGINLLDILDIGGAGVMPGFSCCELYAEIYRRYQAGDREGAAALHSRLAAYFVRWNTSVERVIAMEKEILRRRGLLRTAVCRHPGYSLREEDEAEIDQFMDEFQELLPCF